MNVQNTFYKKIQQNSTVELKSLAVSCALIMVKGFCIQCFVEVIKSQSKKKIHSLASGNCT